MPPKRNASRTSEAAARPSDEESSLTSDSGHSDSTEEDDIVSLVKDIESKLPSMSSDQVFELACRQFDRKTKKKSKPPTVVESERKPEVTNLVMKTLTELPKLNAENWHAWNQRFYQAILTIPKAAAILTDGTDSNEYDTKLDGELVLLILGNCEATGTKAISHLTTRGLNQGPWTAHDLYKKLQAELTKNDKIAIATLYSKAGNIKMINNDVRKLTSEIENLWARGNEMGVDLGEALKVVTLVRCCAANWAYAHIIDSMKANGNGDDYTKIVEALRHKQESIDARPNYKIARMATQGQEERHEGYYRGRRDPKNPDAPPKCYSCGQPGHIARNCKTNQRNPVVARLAEDLQEYEPSAME